MQKVHLGQFCGKLFVQPKNIEIFYVLPMALLAALRHVARLRFGQPKLEVPSQGPFPTLSHSLSHFISCSLYPTGLYK